ncbi:MAG: hypothetical protein IH983_14590 [Planctomycetes bacterium]|nr:hypothetical protein [Planctomycetota bacterium]
MAAPPAGEEAALFGGVLLAGGSLLICAVRRINSATSASSFSTRSVSVRSLLRRLLGAADTTSHRCAAGAANRLDEVGELTRPVSNRADNDRDRRKVVDPEVHPVVYAWGETAGVGREE